MSDTTPPLRRAWDRLRDPPRVSAVMTSFNYGRFVEEAIRSVAAQTRPPDELLVVDDGSTDDSVARIEALLPTLPFPTRFEATPNRGQAAALNLACSWATGGVVAFLDSDDLWAPTKLERTLALMTAQPGGAVYQHNLADGRGGLKRPVVVSGDPQLHWEQLGFVNLATHASLHDLFLPTSGLAFERSVLDRVLPVPEALITCPDAYLTRCALRFGPLVSTPEVLGTWRDHGGNAGSGGRGGRYGRKRFWLPVVAPAVNAFHERHGSPVRFGSSRRRALADRLRHALGSP